MTRLQEARVLLVRARELLDAEHRENPTPLRLRAERFANSAVGAVDAVIPPEEDVA